MTSESVTSALLNFSLDVYKLIQDKKSNIFFSPFSISSVLALTALGAKNNSLHQLREVLHLQAISDDKFHEIFGSLINQISECSKHYILNIANQLFIEKSFTVKPDYLQFCKKYYNGGISLKDFLNNPDGARNDVNIWVETQTQNKIKELLKPGIVTSLTRLVLVNAIYFKGDWMNKFDVKHTQPELFHLSNSESKNVDMMYQKSKFLYYHSEALECKILALPYVQQHLSMFLLLPDAVEGLSELEKNLSVASLDEMIHSSYKCEVHVKIPKFKIEKEFSLKDKLIELGISDLFDSNSDLSGIYGVPGDLFVSAVEHKAFIEVNEEGSEAAAATAGVIMMRCAMRFPTESFIANHPFLYFIRDNTSGIILFMGCFQEV